MQNIESLKTAMTLLNFTPESLSEKSGVSLDIVIDTITGETGMTQEVAQAFNTAMGLPVAGISQIDA